MEIPKNVKTYTIHSSILWFNEEGILYSKPMPGNPPELPKEEIIKELEKFKAIIGNKKVRMLVEVNPNLRPQTKSERDFIAEIINDIIGAMAVVTTSPLARMSAKLFFGLKPPAYAAKIFSNEMDALEWLRQYNR